MRDFLTRLEQQLAWLATTAESTSRPPRRRRFPFAAGGIAAFATGAGLIAMTGTSTAELPILGTPTTDASALRDDAPAAAQAGVDFSAAHRFGTAGGPGYVLVNEKTDTVCLVVPDPTAPGDFGNSCARSRAHVERFGLAAEFPGDRALDPKAVTHFVFVLPDGATDVQLTVSGRTSTPPAESGVVSIALPTEGLLSWTAEGKPRRLLVDGPFPAGGGWQFACPDGQVRTIKPPPQTGAAMTRARTKACAT